MMMTNSLPDTKTMYNALLSRDSSFEGIFFVGVKSTGIFCRPSCSAKKPKLENVEFFDSAKNAMLYGYRPCKLCHPLEAKGKFPEWMNALMKEIENNPSIRIKDYDLLNKGISPHKLRRWFKENLGMTFQSYLRTLRISNAFGRIKEGDKVIEAAYSADYDSLSGFNAIFKKTTGFTPNSSKNKNIVQVTRILTPLGPMLAGATEKGICLLEFVDRKMIETQLKRIRKIFNAELIPGQSKFFKDLREQIDEYFEGKRIKFDMPISIDGTKFQKRAWKALLKIPYGKTVSYEHQAKVIGNSKAVRAVAKANGDNRISIIIPCHRVIGKDGNLTGYGGGIWRKKYLLDLEEKIKTA
jgi:AraC family transcriptional regulator, regulatory protein of adaptative response / methylated-DNA-[protein]-cysteine methyltransferase